MTKRNQREADLEREIVAMRETPLPTREQERAQVAQMREERRVAGEAERERQRAWQKNVDLHAAYGPSMQPPPEPISGPSGNFRIEFRDRGRPSDIRYADDYGTALRKAADGLLGSSGDEAHVFLGDRLASIARLKRDERTKKYFVRFAAGGEKPKKQTRRS